MLQLIKGIIRRVDKDFVFTVPQSRLLNCTFVIQGSLCARIADREVKCPPGRFFLYGPGYPVHYAAGPLGFTAVHTSASVDERINDIQPCVLTFDGRLSRLVRLVYAELKELDHGRFSLHQNLCILLLYQALNVHARSTALTPGHVCDLPFAAKEIIDRNIRSSMPLEKLFVCLPVSYRTLSTQFNRSEGMSLKAWQLRQKIAEARRLLETGDTIVEATAWELGFSSPHHFSKVFLQITGTRPGIYIRGQNDKKMRK